MITKRLKEIYLYKHTLWDMAISGLKAKYASSVMGVYLALINPFLLMTAIGFVFTAVFKVAMPNFGLFVLSGIIPWMFSSNALTEAAGSIVNQQNILRQFSLPREILPLSSILSNFFNFLIGWVILYPVFVFFLHKVILLSPHLLVIMLANLIFIAGLGMILSVLNVFIRDIGHLLSIFLMFLFWITPIFYTVDMVPVKYHWMFNFNPMLPFIISYQQILYNGLSPSMPVSLSVLFLAFLSLILGFLVFLYMEPKILKRL